MFSVLRELSPLRWLALSVKGSLVKGAEYEVVRKCKFISNGVVGRWLAAAVDC